MIPRKAFNIDKKSILTHFTSDIVGEDRRLRFGYSAQDASVKKYIDNSWNELWTELGPKDENTVNHQWFVVTDKESVQDFIEPKIVATCHVAIDKNKRAELGFTVSPAYKGKGLGQALFDRGIDWARSRGVEVVYMQCLSENATMQHIAKKRGMSVITLAPGEKEASVTLTQPKILAAQKDVITDGLAVCDTLLRDNMWAVNKFSKFWLNHLMPN